jgi:Holliday junction resolvase RusA-like endonuclease
MTSFVIDTGTQQVWTIRDRLPDWFLDQQLDDATDAQLAFTCGQHLLSETQRPKMAATIWRPHTAKPDGDNLAKQIGDALNRIAWMDDSQIADVRVTKIWGDRDETIVVIEAIGV